MKRLFKFVYRSIPFKASAAKFLRAIWRPQETVYRHLHFAGIFTVHVDEATFRMQHHGAILENEVFWEGLEQGHEHVSYSLWKQLVKGSRVILDIGANTGIYSLIAKSLNPSATIYAFEPLERVFEKLEGNRRLNNFDFGTIQAAVSDHDGQATLYDIDADHTYAATLNRSNATPGDDIVKHVVNTVRLDSFLETHGLHYLDLMKIDVETHEPEVLEGLGHYLQEFRPNMIIEVLNDACGARLETLVDGCDYLFFNIDDKAGTIRRVDHITKSDHWNYLLCDPGTARTLGLV